MVYGLFILQFTSVSYLTLLTIDCHTWIVYLMHIKFMNPFCGWCLFLKKLLFRAIFFVLTFCLETHVYRHVNSV
jgi:hypothetical protein